MPSKSDARAYAAALRQHTTALTKHTAALKESKKAHENLIAVLDNHAAALERIEDNKRERVRSRLAQATGNTPASLPDDSPVSDLFVGGTQIVDVIMSNINNEFWPTRTQPTLRYKQIKGWKIGKLLDQILKLLS